MTHLKQLISVVTCTLCSTSALAALHISAPQFLGDGSVRISVEADAPMDVDSLQFNLPDAFLPLSLSETAEGAYQALDQTLVPGTVLFVGLGTFHVDKGPLFHWDFKPRDSNSRLAGFEPTYLVGDSQPIPLAQTVVPEPATWTLFGISVVLLLASVQGGRKRSLDVAKALFQIHGVDGRGTGVLGRQLKRADLARFWATLPPCLIGMEACASAHY